ncbi:rho guanine nucleotide exchange factor 15 [Antennarius striatus]|uniref:rho guanine nucleotide exchange factor 15 n=1 Tax=Antennarius striatus TaxID=241820 RepID=UPI0035AEA957
MSDQEAPPQATSPPPLKADNKPNIPPKPPAQTTPPPPGGRAGSTTPTEGKVRSIVDKFSKQGRVGDQGAEQSTNATLGMPRMRRFRRPPTLKPKPQRASLPLEAPPLPLKRSRRPRASQWSDEGGGVNMEGARSEPDGKEVDAQPIGGGEAEAELRPPSPLSPTCDPACGCVCHLQHPGMKLVWVPLEGGAEDSDEERSSEEEEDGGVGDGENEVGPPPDSEASQKAQFHQSLDILLGEGHRRLSDPGPQSALALICLNTPPTPQNTSDSAHTHQGRGDSEEESIYEFTLPEPRPPKATPSALQQAPPPLDVPVIRVRKPARRSKLTYSPSDPSSEFQAPPEDPEPPTVPPRMPVAPDNHLPTPVHRGGVPLLQPTPEERRSLCPPSPGGLSPRRALTPPLVLPVRAPPPPPKTDARRLSSVSLPTLPQDRDGVQNGEEDETDEGGAEPWPEGGGSLDRKSSLGWESRLQDEPLYQTYRDTVITKEIRRQTVCRNISKTSVDFASDWTSPRRVTTGGGASPSARSSRVPPPGQSTLWQDLPAVRDSGILTQLAPEQWKYQESMFEVLTSEASYLRSLRVLTEHFLDSRDLQGALVIRDRKTLFSNILRVREVSERFLRDLEERIFGELLFPDICDIIHYHAQHHFPAYIDYVRNQIYQEKTFSSLMKNNLPFAGVISRLQEAPQCQRLPFMSFLLLPFQRITRIKMLIENILRRTKEQTKEEQSASKALASVSKIIDECNTQVGKMRQMEELILISQTLEFDKLKAVPIISQTRFLEKKGELQEMSKAGTLFNMRAKFTPVYLFLFNDLLVITIKKGAERFVVLDHAHRSLVQVQPLEAECPPCENCFNLTLLENHQGRCVERLLRAPTQSDMHRWMAAFPNPAHPEGDEEEVIYEDWDCPQVQCVLQYAPQQADELALEPTEIINVVRKTNEGFLEGIRLADGQKGWFPAANVTEITNEHVRRRNLRERYRVLQAASVVATSKGRSSTVT